MYGNLNSLASMSHFIDLCGHPAVAEANARREEEVKRPPTHPEFHPLVQESLLVELAQQPRLRDDENASRRLAMPTRHITEEVVLLVTQDA